MVTLGRTQILDIVKLQQDSDLQRNDHNQEVSLMREHIAQLEAQVVQAQERDDARQASTADLRDKLHSELLDNDLLISHAAELGTQAAELDRECQREDAIAVELRVELVEQREETGVVVAGKRSIQDEMESLGERLEAELAEATARAHAQLVDESVQSCCRCR